MAEDFAPLTGQILSEGLSEILPVCGGGGFAFTKLDCSERDPPLNHLGNKLEDCEYLRHVVLSRNEITDLVAVSRLPRLLSLQADKNKIISIDCLATEPEDGSENAGTNLPWCQQIDLSENKLTALPSLRLLERLRFLKLAGNEIASLETFGAHPSLEELVLQGNKLTHLRGLGPCHALQLLDVSENELQSLEGLDAPVLTRLDAHANQLETLAHIDGAASCIELDLGNNKLIAPEADTMPKDFIMLGNTLHSLTTLVIEGNPVAGNKDLVVYCVPQLVQVDGAAITQEERDEYAARGKEVEEAEAAREKAAAEAPPPDEGGGEEDGGGE
eukprot:CAMPEP_0117514864 /NCGR_PEP_ID=MMETSP0784-20121206/30285_1 /TAXON_ID=39447 /ORGANISM="" /LENGTH=329 /DNA_ID=CAMNT_0005310665 /DNA_START=27 /DNA_END=1016 /DNA_ORIENTATION=+